MRFSETMLCLPNGLFESVTPSVEGDGPVSPLQTVEGKIFGGIYALFSGLVFLVVAGLLLAPFFHRMLHRFHLGDSSCDS